MHIQIPEERTTKHGGYILLVSVLIIGAVAITVSTTLLLLGINSQQASFAFEQSAQARGLVNACAEEALQEIRDSTPFTGTSTLIFGQGSCEFEVTSQGGQNRTISASSTVDTTIRKVKVIITAINPQIIVSSWQEVSDL